MCVDSLLGLQLEMEKVYVENGWYDGPRKGIANYNGMPHRFVANFDDLKGYNDTFKLFPVTKDELAMEIEQWEIFVEWNKKYELGQVDASTHPGHGGIDKRWDEIEDILKPIRESIPSNTFESKAKFEQIDQKNRYESTGPDYGVVWQA